MNNLWLHAGTANDQLRVHFSVPLFLKQEQAGIKLHSGRTRLWNKAGIDPRDIDDSGPVWCKDGVKILGTPVGSDSFVEMATDERIIKEAFSLGFRTFNAFGNFFSNAPGEDATISSAQFLPASLPSTQTTIIKE